METDLKQTLQVCSGLVDAWCERRCISALRRILRGWPAGPLTDDLANLMTALQDVRAFARSEITEDEMTQINHAILRLQELVLR